MYLDLAEKWAISSSQILQDHRTKQNNRNRPDYQNWWDKRQRWGGNRKEETPWLRAFLWLTMDSGIWGFQNFQESELERDRREREREFLAFGSGNMNDADYKRREGAELFMVVAEAEFYVPFFFSYLPLSLFPFNTIHFLGNFPLRSLTPDQTPSLPDQRPLNFCTRALISVSFRTF